MFQKRDTTTKNPIRKLILVMVMLTITSFEVYSQIKFEKGYFIDESNKKTECLIKNVDWKNNPTDFGFRLSNNAPVQTANMGTIKEFGIYNGTKFIRATTHIDRSSERVNKMSDKRNPNFQEELLFLQVLIEGQASLFYYNDGNLKRFFYQLKGAEVQQLVYKKYITADIIKENNAFKQELYLKLQCKEIELSDIEHLRYAKKDLTRIFIKYNQCQGDDYINYQPKQKKDFLRLSIRPGLNSSSLEVQNLKTDTRNADIDSKIGIRFGVETEFVLPFNKNKWSILVEPTYQYLKSETTNERSNVSGGILITKVDYKSIELPIGLRHYFYLNEHSKLFVNASAVFDFAHNSTIKFIRKDGSTLNKLDIKPSPNAAFGVGYKFKDTYSVELRYYTHRNLIADYWYWSSDYKTISLVIGYSLFH